MAIGKVTEDILVTSVLIPCQTIIFTSNEIKDEKGPAKAVERHPAF